MPNVVCLANSEFISLFVKSFYSNNARLGKESYSWAKERFWMEALVVVIGSIFKVRIRRCVLAMRCWFSFAISIC
jgi:hypothetical protein